MNTVLKDHPALTALRALFQTVGAAIRPKTYEDGLEKIKTIPIEAAYTPDLQKALKLLKKNAKGILAYKKVNLPFPETRMRVNCEWEMRKGRRITKLRYGLKNIFKKAFLLSQKFKTTVKVVLKKDT